MPTQPKTPRVKIAPPGSSGQKAGTASDEPKNTRGSSPFTSEVRRTPKTNTLKVRLERFYMMLGTFLVPLGKFIPQANPIGNNLKEFSTEAADAWIDLAEEDPKVKKYLESITGASTWGNVIGIHFVILMGAISQDTVKQMMPQEAVNDPVAFGREMGLSDEDIEKAVKMAQGIVSDRPVEKPQTEVRTERENNMDQINQEIKDLKAGMATPAQMGVQNDGQGQWSKPLTTGGIH